MNQINNNKFSSTVILFGVDTLGQLANDPLILNGIKEATLTVVTIKPTQTPPDTAVY